MIRVVFSLVVLALVAAGFGWLADRPGGLVLTVGAYRIETSLAAAAAGLIALVVLIDLAWSILRFVLRLPATIGFLGRSRNRTKGFDAVTRGMIAVGSGDAKLARRSAEEARRRLGAEPLALLLQAQAAQMAGDKSAADGAFRAMLERNDTRLLGLRGLFVEARRRGDSAAAVEHAEEAARLLPSAAWAGEAVLERHCAEGRWTEALAALDRASSGLDRAVVRRRRAVLLTADALAAEPTAPETALAEAKEALKLAPDLAPAAVLAGRLLIARGDLRKASKLLEAAWREAPHPEIADLYVHLRHGDAARDRLARAERLLLLRPDHADARYAVALAALDARDFTRVHSAVQPLLAGRPTVRICLLMARVEEIEHGDTGLVREWLARASRAPRDEAWVADGVASETWMPVSPATGKIDAFRWMRPMPTVGGPGGGGSGDMDAVSASSVSSDAVALPPHSVAPAVTLQDTPEPDMSAARSQDGDRENGASAPVRPSVAAPVAPDPIKPDPRDIVPAVPPSATVAPGTPASPNVSAPSPVPASAPPRPSAQAVAPQSGRPRRSEVVFPLPAAPDDPGPGAEDDPSTPPARLPA